MVITYLMLLVLFVGPVGLGSYLEGFVRSVTPAQLSALTVTSPFSAAFSVARPPSSGTAEAQLSTNVSNAAISSAPLVPRVGLPIWAVYLLITPPLCLVLFVMTYFVFRWRWWKAGATI